VKQVSFVNLTYIPHEVNQSAALNFHITQKEKQDIYQSIYNPQNQKAIKEFLQLLNK
jgi:hypothetical protein